MTRLRLILCVFVVVVIASVLVALQACGTGSARLASGARKAERLGSTGRAWVGPPPSAAVASSPAAGKPRAVGPAGPRTSKPGGEAAAAADHNELVSFADEELWVIQRAGTGRGRGGDQEEDVPGSGSLICWPEGVPQTWGRQVPVPLKHTDVAASILGYISSVNVTQKFTNPFATKIEAVYVFPLPENAAVSEFVMAVGERRIRGIIREREEARQIYEAARAQGHVASLLTQERPNIFTQRVANIEPGKSIDINITYYATLAYSNGGYEWVFPMVVGPRFNPPVSGADSIPAAADAGSEGSTPAWLPPATKSETAAANQQPDAPRGAGIGAVAHDQRGTSGQAVEIAYLRPRERTGHDISLTVELDAGVDLQSVDSPSHRTEIERADPRRARVRLAASDSIPNKDFVLRYTVAGDAVETGLMTHRDERGGFFTLMLVPPRDLSYLERGPVEMVFVLDCSGSMQGRPMEQAKAAVSAGLSRLREGDTFQIIDFAESTSELGANPLPATDRYRRQGLSYVRSLQARGGTYMINGLRASLGFPGDAERLRFVAFLTDGFIGNEAEVLRELDAGLGAARVFGMGVGSSPNRYLMDEMSRMGRGAVSYLGLNDRADDVMDSFFDVIAKPALTDIAIDWGSARVTETYPSRAPDLFVGRPVIITGRYEGEFASPIRVTGRAGGKTREFSVSVAGAAAPAAAAKALPQVWARMKVADLARRSIIGEPGAFEPAIRQLALDYSLMSSYTAFVAVDAAEQTAGDHGVTVAVPVPVPDGVRYETTVPAGSSRQGGGG